MKLHLGCGTVYLKGYENLDGAPDYIAEFCEDPAVIERNATTLDKYYKQDFGTLPGYVVADRRHDLRRPLPYYDEEIEEVVMLHVLEHVPAYDRDRLLADILRVLRPGGSLYVAVPDLKETARLLAEAKTSEQEDWAVRLVHGTQRNSWSHHFCGYLPRTLRELLKQAGFVSIGQLPNINFYPAIHMRAMRPMQGAA